MVFGSGFLHKLDHVFSRKLNTMTSSSLACSGKKKVSSVQPQQKFSYLECRLSQHFDKLRLGTAGIEDDESTTHITHQLLATCYRQVGSTTIAIDVVCPFVSLVNYS
jgi:hypothetical protein